MDRLTFDLGLLPLTPADYPEGGFQRLWDRFHAEPPVLWWRAVVLARRRTVVPTVDDLADSLHQAKAEHAKGSTMSHCPECRSELPPPRFAWVYLRGSIELDPAPVAESPCEECGEQAVHTTTCRIGEVYAGCLARVTDESSWTMMLTRRCLPCGSRIYDALDNVVLPDGRVMQRDTRFVVRAKEGT